MSKIALEGNASGTGTFTIASPNSNSNYTLTLPSSTGTVVVTGGAQTIEFAAGSAASPSITFTGDTNTGIFSPAADTIAFAEGGAEAMRIDSSGNVGIGTNSPTQRLDVVAANSQIHFGAATTGGGYLMSTANGQFRISGGAVYDGSNWIAKSTTASIIGDDATGDIKFLSNTSLTAGNSFTPTERMRIDSSGNVGIGTSSPSDRLQVNGASAANTQVRVVSTATAAERSSIEFFNNTVSRGRVGGANDFDGLTLDSSTTESAAVIRFRTGGGTLTERARITSGGYFKASNDGTYAGSTESYHEFRQTADTACLYMTGTNASLSTSGVFFLDISRNTTNNSFYAISYYNSGAAAYKLRIADSGNVTNTNGSYGTISDAKLKQDIVDAGSQWDDIKNLRFRKYRLKSEVELDPNAKPFLGLVAQEAELVSPGLIEEHKDTKQEIKTREVEKTREIPAVLNEEGNEVEPARTETYTETEEYTETVDLGTTTKSIKTSILYMKAVKALQEAMTRIEALEAEVAALKGQ